MNNNMNIINTSQDTFSNILQFLDNKSLDNLHKTNKQFKKDIEKNKKTYKINYLKGKWEKLYILIENDKKFKNIDCKYNHYKNKTIDNIIHIFFLWLENCCKNKKIIFFAHIYGHTFDYFNSHYIINPFSLLKRRNKMIKKYLSNNKNDNKIIEQILYLTRNIKLVSGIYPYQDFYDNREEHYNNLRNL